ncbi:MAG: argininosuccinate lyase [Chloroflexi bacterium]|nr:argininosuccinate lyase [Chloroflexota bacterium]
MDFGASIAFDWRLWPHEIAASLAHARMLARQGILTEQEGQRLVEGLAAVREEYTRGHVPRETALEDIHTTVEHSLETHVGPLARKLHTARSRNDQVATDLRLYTRDAIDTTGSALRTLRSALLARAEGHATALVPGYTHLQRAQPVLLAHHLLAYEEMFARDGARFLDARRRCNLLPLGSGALAGVPYPIDRDFVARELGFDGVTANSLDAVADRDFVVEYEASAALAMAHLSRLAEELITWSSAEFGFVELDDAYATGSSLMPQKKNPDLAELIRGKCGRTLGHLMGTLTVLKGLPLAYNKDLQEDKEALFDTVDTVLGSLEMMAAMIATTRFDTGRMGAAASDPAMIATDLADYLVRRGLAFREAHAVVGRIIGRLAGEGKSLPELTLTQLQEASPLFAADALQIDAAAATAARDVPGGTAPERVQEALAAARRRLAAEAPPPSPEPQSSDQRPETRDQRPDP